MEKFKKSTNDVNALESIFIKVFKAYIFYAGCSANLQKG